MSYLKSANLKTEDRQWDARFNIPNNDYLTDMLNRVKEMDAEGKFKYVLVSGIEIGTRPTHDDYQVQHVHCAFILHNRMSGKSLLNNLGIKEGYGYYLVPRNRQLPYSGWREHHVKEFSKVDPKVAVLHESGELPNDVRSAKRKGCEVGPEEKKRKLDDILIELRSLIEDNKEEEAWTKFPRNYLTYGEKIKAMVSQKRDFFHTQAHPHIWLYGFAGTGKTALLSFVYPNYYKKNLDNKFFDLYKPLEHTHVMLEDLDHTAVERLGINFVKTICDEAGFSIDQKYKTPQLAKTTCLVTSNFTINEILNGMENTVGIEQNLAALLRRFYHVRVDSLFRLLGLKLLPKWDRVQLKKEGNQDFGKLFITWDYVTDTPLCTPIASPEYYQEIIRDYYYK